MAVRRKPCESPGSVHFSGECVRQRTCREEEAGSTEGVGGRMPCWPPPALQSHLEAKKGFLQPLSAQDLQGRFLSLFRVGSEASSRGGDKQILSAVAIGTTNQVRIRELRHKPRQVEIPIHPVKKGPLRNLQSWMPTVLGS